MLKYKSPLSRLLEGTSRQGAKTEADSDAAGDATPQDTSSDGVFDGDFDDAVADLDRLRNSLSGGGEPEASAPAPQKDNETDTKPSIIEAVAAKVTPPQDSADTAPEAATERLTLAEENRAEPLEMTNPVVDPEPAIDLGSVATETVESKPAPKAAAPVEAKPKRSERAKTTFLGFETADSDLTELMDSVPVEKTATVGQMYPVGWLVITSGPGRGNSIGLTEGLMQIGRNDDQAIQLDFGDLGISRSSHAVIAYDPETRVCYLGHGGKANLVRLNGNPVLSTTALTAGDEIRISETVMRFVAFCDETFDWRDN